MATITPFVAKGSYVNQKQEVKAKKMVWIKVGEGTVVALDDQEVSIAGKISFLGYNGDLNIHLTLTDEDADATEGSCILQLNSHIDENAKYAVKNGELAVSAAFGDKKQTIGISPCNGGSQTQCRLSGDFNVTVHLDPVN